ncbi:MAG TPA: hypothetical protein VNT26_02695 [Candidatus Sulfotelmatobacter sp.]|nr:hypothetical protein [Candidatus Sulfotelmatobacter sp.]
MKSVYFGTPAILCGIASFVALVATVRHSALDKYAQPILYAFLPGCFLLTGAIMMLMHREIRRLRRRVARLEGRKKSPVSLQVVSSDEPLANAGYASQERNGFSQQQILSTPAQPDSQAPAASRARTAAV